MYDESFGAGQEWQHFPVENGAALYKIKIYKIHGALLIA